jgi:hypothetical protein
MKTVTRVLFVAILILVVLPRWSESCAPGFPQAVFTRQTRPDKPAAVFAKGRIGIPLPTWKRAYLVVAYRYFSDRPLSAMEQRSMLAFFGYDDVASLEPEPIYDVINRWLRERAKYRDGIPPEVEPYRHGKSPYYEYANCLPPAFETAIHTLQLRAKQFGIKSPELQEWITGQDTVFANCTDISTTLPNASQTKARPVLLIPSPLPSSAHSLLRADRAYQIAAAHFYATQLPEALREFDAIAKDESSPWHVIAHYMAVRTIIRQSWAETKAGSQEGPNPAILAQAPPRIASILADNKLKAIHHDTERLQSLVRFHLHPDQRQHELARILVSGRSGVDFGQHLVDYKLLLDRFLDVDPEFQDWPLGGPLYDQRVREWKAKRYPELKKERSDDLSDWLMTVQSVSDASKLHAVKKWRTTGSMPWLFAAMLKSSGKNTAAQDLLQAAGRVSATSPAYAATAFHRSRLLRESGDVQGASRVVEEILASSKSLPVSTVNLLKDEQMRNSISFEEFRERLVRTPVEVSFESDDSSEEESYSCDAASCNLALYGVPKPKASSRLLPQFDVSVAETLNMRLSVDVLTEIAISGKLPNNLQNKLAPAVWARAVLLGNEKAAGKVAESVINAHPEMKPFVDAYAATKDGGERHFIAVFTILHFPGLRPFVEGAFPRTTEFAKIDKYRDNWWCSDVGGIPYVSSYDKQYSDNGHELRELEQRTEATVPPYLDQNQNSQADMEWKKLRAMGWVGVYLPSETLAWAQKHPDDPRVPEALHLAWRARRYSCDGYSEHAPVNSEHAPANLSRDIFRLLHNRYPNSTWTKKTPVWP